MYCGVVLEFVSSSAAYELPNYSVPDGEWIKKAMCRGVDVNLFFPPDVNKADLHNIHMLAWAKNLKTLYYLRSEAISRADNVSNKVKREIIFEQSDCLSCEG